MIRRLFTFAVVVSSLLFVVVGADSYRSYSVSETVEYRFGSPVTNGPYMLRKHVLLDHYRGRTMMTYRPVNVPIGDNTNWTYDRSESGADWTVALMRSFHPTAKSFAGILWASWAPADAWAGADTAISMWWLLVPDYALMLTAALLPATWFARRMTNRNKRRTGHCQTCSYDLAGNVSGVCPECGTPIPAKVTA